MTNETGVIGCPETIRNRSDAVQLWKHLLSRGIAFHWEDDPADIIDTDTREPVFSKSEARQIARLYDEVESLGDEWVYDAALSLMKLTLLVDPEVLRDVPLAACASFQRCGSRSAATRVLARVAPREARRARHLGARNDTASPR